MRLSLARQILRDRCGFCIAGQPLVEHLCRLVERFCFADRYAAGARVIVIAPAGRKGEEAGKNDRARCLGHLRHSKREAPVITVGPEIVEGLNFSSGEGRASTGSARTGLFAYISQKLLRKEKGPRHPDATPFEFSA